MVDGKLELGVVEFCFSRRGQHPRERLIESVELAEYAESLGYRRFWLGEHHAPHCASPAPEALLPIIAGVTDKIRVGATVLLRYHSPLRMAEIFKQLDLVFPSRIDALIGRGGPSDPVFSELLAGAPVPPANADPSLRDRIAYFSQFLRDIGRVVPPAGPADVQLWVLSANGISASYAQENEASVSFALFFGTPPQMAKSTPGLRARRGDRTGRRVNISVAGVCADTGRQAEDLAAQGILECGMGITPDVVGEPQYCRERLHELSEAYDVKEIMFLDLSPSLDGRKRSLELLASQCA